MSQSIILEVFAAESEAWVQASRRVAANPALRIKKTKVCSGTLGGRESNGRAGIGVGTTGAEPCSRFPGVFWLSVSAAARR